MTPSSPTPETARPTARPAGRTTADSCAAEVGEIFARVFSTLDDWRDGIAAAVPDRADLDVLVESLVVPALLASADSPVADAPPATESLLIGAGFIAAPQYVNGRDAHFAWWLGPLASNPLLGNTSGASRLDLATRVHTEYLRDFRELEWYAVPEATNQTHVTGPYVDQLCTCDYIITLTMPVRLGERMIGVVGADVYVKRLEQVLLPHFLALPGPVVLVNQAGRVVISTEPTLPAGDILPNRRHPADDYDLLPCPGTPFLIATRIGSAAI
ncbi:cache domain-containing protein [Cryobacterium fucosi]